MDAPEADEVPEGAVAVANPSDEGAVVQRLHEIIILVRRGVKRMLLTFLAASSDRSRSFERVRHAVCVRAEFVHRVLSLLRVFLRLISIFFQ